MRNSPGLRASYVRTENTVHSVAGTSNGSFANSKHISGSAIFTSRVCWQYGHSCEQRIILAREAVHQRIGSSVIACDLPANCLRASMWTRCCLSFFCEQFCSMWTQRVWKISAQVSLTVFSIYSIKIDY